MRMAVRYRLAVAMRRLIALSMLCPPRLVISRLAWPSWMVGIRSMPCASRLRWSMRTPSGSMRLHCLAQSARSRSRNSVESKGLFDTSTRFQTLRFLAPVFCSPVAGSMTGIRSPFW